ncbi:MAG: VCBS repeat-containing protein [Actinomycetota bacterium]|nr:VCBS repeat-containing protein [Actinomycetota bacterium]
MTRKYWKRLVVFAVLAYLLALCDFTVPLAASGGVGVKAMYDAGSSFYDAKVTASDLDGDGFTELLIGNSNGYLYCFDHAARVKWAYQTGGRIRGAPAASDVDGDGKKEIFVGDMNGWVWGFDSNGNVLSRWGWPKKTPTIAAGNLVGVYSSPAIGDINGDGVADVVVGTYGHYIFAWSYTGSTLPGWPYNNADTIWSSPALADLDGDGLLEVIIGADCTGGPGWPYPPGGLLYVFNGDGSLLPGFPQHSPEVLWSSPAVADIDGDGLYEIIIGTGHYYKAIGKISTEGHRVYAFNHDGSAVTGWPVVAAGSTMSSPAVGDIDSDGVKEVVIACNGQGGIGAEHLMAIKPNGSVIWDVSLYGPHLNSPCLGDVNADGVSDALIPSGGALNAFDGSGARIFSECPDTERNFCITTPAYGDFDKDGKAEVAYGTGDDPDYGTRQGGKFYILKCDSPANSGSWPMFHRDESNKGTITVKNDPTPPTPPSPRAQSASYHTYILIMNPGKKSTKVKIDLMNDQAVTMPVDLLVPPASRQTFFVNEFMLGREVSAKVTSDEPIICERAMYFNRKGVIGGGHDSIGATEKSTTWYLAEGYSAPNFDEYVLVFNPNDFPVHITMTFMVEGEQPQVYDFDMLAHSRHTTDLKWRFGPRPVSVSTKVEATGEVVCERAMYFNYSNQFGGHDSIGVTEPSTSWCLPEGYTAQAYDAYILIQNPNDTRATGALSFLRSDGYERALGFGVEPKGRYTVKVDDVPGFEAAEFSTEISSNIGVVAERAMYFNSEGRDGGHNSIGVPNAGEKWYLAEGYTGGGFDTYVLIMNTETSPAKVKTTFMRDDGYNYSRTDVLAPRSRFTIHLDDVPGFESVEASTLVESQDGSKIIAERAMYFMYNNLAVAGGHDSIGVSKPANEWYFAEGYTGN